MKQHDFFFFRSIGIRRLLVSFRLCLIGRVDLRGWIWRDLRVLVVKVWDWLD